MTVEKFWSVEEPSCLGHMECVDEIDQIAYVTQSISVSFYFRFAALLIGFLGMFICCFLQHLINTGEKEPFSTKCVLSNISVQQEIPKRKRIRFLGARLNDFCKAFNQSDVDFTDSSNSSLSDDSCDKSERSLLITREKKMLHEDGESSIDESVSFRGSNGRQEKTRDHNLKAKERDTLLKYFKRRKAVALCEINNTAELDAAESERKQTAVGTNDFAVLNEMNYNGNALQTDLQKLYEFFGHPSIDSSDESDDKVTKKASKVGVKKTLHDGFQIHDKINSMKDFRTKETERNVAKDTQNRKMTLFEVFGHPGEDYDDDSSQFSDVSINSDEDSDIVLARQSPNKPRK